MSEDANARVSEFDDMAQECEAIINWIDDKMENGRVRSPEHARARQGYWRIKLKAISEWRKLKEASTLDELTERVEKLESADEAPIAHSTP